jgi:sirohydrochlorin ferrochelatase
MVYPERRVDVDQEHERQRLRKERERLNRQIAKLIAESVGQKDGGDPLDVEQHRERLEQHRMEFRAFRADLERFHRLYGRLGE